MIFGAANFICHG